MPQTTWSEALSVGVEHIDNQHKHLLVLLQDLTLAVDKDGGGDVSAAALRSLCDYAVEHFAAEEALMDMDAYPEYDLHVIQHMECTTKALEFLETYSAGAEVDMKAFVAFLGDWVTNHIVETDQTLGRFLKGRAQAAS